MPRTDPRSAGRIWAAVGLPGTERR